MRNQSELSYRRRINQVVLHVHHHLADDLDSSVLADRAAMSRFHFHRIFSAMTGMTPQYYVLRARLAAAMDALRTGPAAVGQIALDCGFDSGASLAKALRREFGLSPGAVRSAAIDPRLSLAAGPSLRSTTHRRKTMLQPSFVDLPEQRMLCATERGAFNNDMGAAAQRAFGRLWPAAERLGVTQRMTGCLALCPDEIKGHHDPDARFIAAIVFEGEAPSLQGLERIELHTEAAGRYAVFRHLGPYDTLWQTWRAVYGDWVPVAPVALRDAMPFERYVVTPDQAPPEALVTDIHVPVKG